MTRRPAARRGTSLVEVLVTLTLLLPTLGIGALVLRRLLLSDASIAAAQVRTAALSDARLTLVRHLRLIGSAAVDLHAAGGSVLELTTTVGIATVCRARGDTLYVTLPADTLPWASTLPRSVTVTDGVRVWQDSSASWVQRGVRAVTASAAGCGVAHAPWPGVASQRLLLTDSLSGIRPGAPVRVMERERWTLGVSGDGTSSLMLASWNPVTASYAVAQPLVSSLAPSGDAGGAGFQVRARDSAGAVLPAALAGGARTVDLLLRSAPHARHGVRADSVRVYVDHP